MQILLVRHGQAGKADPRKHPDDDLRPLTPKGRKAFRRAAKGLAALLPGPPLRVYASPAERCAATAAILADRLGLKPRAVAALDLLHHSRAPEASLRTLARMRLPSRLALVGHEPFLGRLASLLVSGSPGARLPLAKGGACLIEIPPGRGARRAGLIGAGELKWLLTQDQLAACAP